MKKKILVRAPNWLGDAIMSTPFLRRLRDREPEADLTVLCRPAVREIFQSFPGIQSVLLFQEGEGLRALVARIRAGRFDTGYVLPPSFSSAMLFFLARIPERIGYDTDFRRWLLTQPRALDERYHYVRRYLGLIGEAGREVERTDLFFPTPGGAIGRARSFLSSQGIPWRPPFLAVAPGSQAPARRWFPERFAALIDRLPEKEWPVVLLLGAPGDVPFVRQVEALCRRRTANLCGETNLPLLGELLRQSAALITNESGIMHAAWAMGTPTVVLAGPSEPRVTSPFGARVRVIQHREVPCVPCVKNECYRAKDGYMECLEKIGVEEVMKALAEIREPAKIEGLK